MPYLKPSWRSERNLQWLSRILCVVRLHYWFRSSVTHKPLVCVSCKKKTAHFRERS